MTKLLTRGARETAALIKPDDVAFLEVAARMDGRDRAVLADIVGDLEGALELPGGPAQESAGNRIEHVIAGSQDSEDVARHDSGAAARIDVDPLAHELGDAAFP